MAFRELIEQHAAASVYVDDANPRLKRAICFAGDQWAKNSQGIYVDYADEERGQSKALRVMSAAGNFQVEGGQKAHYNNGFSIELAREAPGMEMRVDGEWVDVPLSPRPYQRASKEGKEASYTAYDLGYVAEEGELSHRFESNLGWGKGDYTWTSLRAETAEYRFRLNVNLSVPAAEPYFLRHTTIENDSLISRGRAYATWVLRNGQPLTLDFHDMVVGGQYDAAESRFDASGATLYSLPFTLKPGQSYTVDPTITPDAGTSGAGAAADSSWGIDGTAGNTTAVGIVAGTHILCNYNRFALSPIAGGDTLNSGAFEPYVGNVGLFASSTANWGGFNGDGRGNPGSGTYSTEYNAARVVTNADNYGSVGTDYQSTGRKSFALTAGALTDLAGAVSDGYFVICNQGNGVIGNQYVFLTAHNNTTSANRPRLSIVYTTGGGGGGSIAPHMMYYRKRRAA